jgi:hypothetical protein
MDTDVAGHRLWLQGPVQTLHNHACCHCLEVDHWLTNAGTLSQLSMCACMPALLPKGYVAITAVLRPS